MSTADPAPAAPRRGRRWLLFGSLALNLFFIGIAVALAVRSPPPRWERDVVVRIERIADALPAGDAAILRDAVTSEREAINTAQQKYRDSREQIRATLRMEPFSEENMAAAMAAARAARQNYDEVLHGMFADVATKMSPEGRRALADWRSRRRAKQERQ